MTEARLGIGALSERAAVSPDLLRAWEWRYGLLTPARTAGGFRLYSSADEERVRSMRRHLNAGVPAAEAARLGAFREQPARRPAAGPRARLGSPLGTDHRARPAPRGSSTIGR
jgi:DNA-binding transcriptional MerR regulator